ncbi:MAG: RtcB family protein [Candidatus Pacearchaeota archaeon]|nr:MAG: RtcB family protein [Candidatus Pacearchaeota archaeon]
MEIKLKKISDIEWEIPKGTIQGMKVPGIVFASKILLEKMKLDKTLQQTANVATLPGIYKHAICLPDGHEGYGFPIGGVAALDFKEGGISPGGIGYDINCGVRLLRTSLTDKEIHEKLKELVMAIFRNVPSGLGSKGKVRLRSRAELDEVLKIGARWAVEKGYGWKKDLKHLESEGELKIAEPRYVSDTAIKRGLPQLGSLGAGNHFLEIQRVGEIFDEKTAKVFGIEKKDQITIMIHCGSRGLGHQVCTDYLREMEKTFPDILKKLPDRELIYAPAGSELADRYLKAMSCAANYAWANRQMIVHQIRESFEKVFNRSAEDMGMDIIYDVAHNIAKIETHKINGKDVKVYMHRKGATRAFGPGHPEIPSDYQKVGQPVLLPGSMGTASFVLVGSKTAMEKTFGSTAHGAGRLMSRHSALKQFRGEEIKKQLEEEKKMFIRSASWKGIAEEAPGAYKDVEEVARVSHKAGIGNLVVRLRPVGVVKG